MRPHGPRTLSSVAGIAAALALTYLLWNIDVPRVHGRPGETVSAPLVLGSGPSLRFYAVGDTGTGDSRQRHLARAMGLAAREDEPEFVLLLGDNVYPSGVRSTTDPAWERAIAPYDDPALDVPFYPVLGNHDYSGNVDAQVAWSGDERWNMPARYYSFERDVGDFRVLFVFTDTMEIVRGEPNDRDQQLGWIRRTLASSDAEWKLVTGHHTYASGGMHGRDGATRKVRARLGALLEECGADLYLSGHDHHMAWMLPDVGVPHLISGAGGNPRDVDWTDETIMAHAGLGFAHLIVEEERIGIEFISVRGACLSTHVLEATSDAKPGEPER